MTRLFAVFLAFAMLCAGAQSASAQDQDGPQLTPQGATRQWLGYGWLLTNDVLGDGKDRWRTGSVQASRFWGPERAGALPDRFGQLIELRTAGEIIAPEDLGRVTPGERPYAGVLSIGLHTHFATGGFENSAGLDLNFTGSQTKLDSFQSSLHDAVGAPELSSAVRDQQVSDDVHPTVVVESARRYDLGARAQLRPFVEGRAGLETLVRVGADLSFGVSQGTGPVARDTVTGHRYQAGRDWPQGARFVLGADIAYVEESELLPDSRGAEAEDTRARVRTGVQWQSAGRFGGFYGLTWLSEEFTGQREGQFVGSLRLNFNF